jgi:hypothetical protein
LSSGSSIADKDMLACIDRAFSGLSFPSDPKPTTVEWTTTFAVGAFGGSSMSSLPPFVLTRLHARYGKDSLGADLVFKEAEPIVGGRERLNEAGKLEEGAMKSSFNNFQARYAIRHSWPGAITCEKPIRNRWGGRWPASVSAGAGVAEAGPPGSDAPLAATKLAYVPRGRIDVAKMFGNISLAAAPIADAAEPAGDGGAATDAAAPADGGGDAGGAAPAAASKCGCRVLGGDTPIGAAAFIGLALAGAAFLRRLVCSRAQ